MYEFLLTVHVLCAVIWIGGGVTMHIFGRLATKEGPERQLVFTGQSIRLGNVLFAPLAVVLLVAGILLVDEVGYSYGDLWITIGFVGFLASFVVGRGLLPARGQEVRRDRGRRGTRIAGRHGDLPAGGEREQRRDHDHAAGDRRDDHQAGLIHPSSSLASDRRR